jgi:hypothetical protein
MTTLAEIQMKQMLLNAPQKEEKALWAQKIILVRAIEYIDGLRLFPIEEKDIKKISALVFPCNIPEINRVIEEIEAESRAKKIEHEDAIKRADIVG